MKFNLEEALSGKPVMLRNGRKAYVISDIRKYRDDLEEEPEHPLKVLLTPYDYIEGYSASGKYAHEVRTIRYGEKINSVESEFDIVGMWEES